MNENAKLDGKLIFYAKIMPLIFNFGLFFIVLTWFWLGVVSFISVFGIVLVVGSVVFCLFVVEHKMWFYLSIYWGFLGLIYIFVGAWI